MISPVRYSGRSGSSSQARANISAGPTSQFSTRRAPSIRRSPVTRPSSEYRTLASTGYIISSRPMAIGRQTVPDLDGVDRASSRPGHQPAEAEPERHRRDDPDRQEPVERGQPLQDRRVVGDVGAAVSRTGSLIGRGAGDAAVSNRVATAVSAAGRTA